MLKLTYKAKKIQFYKGDVMKCLICENLYPSHYKQCPICGNNLVKEKFAPKVEEVEEVELITPFVEFTPLDDFEG